MQNSKDLPWKSYYLSSSLTILLFLLFVFSSHCLESFNVCLQIVQMLISRSSDKHKVILKHFNKLRPLVHSEGSVITQWLHYWLGVFHLLSYWEEWWWPLTDFKMNTIFLYLCDCKDGNHKEFNDAGSYFNST